MVQIVLCEAFKNQTNLLLNLRIIFLLGLRVNNVIKATVNDFQDVSPKAKNFSHSERVFHGSQKIPPHHTDASAYHTLPYSPSAIWKDENFPEQFLFKTPSNTPVFQTKQKRQTFGRTYSEVHMTGPALRG